METTRTVPKRNRTSAHQTAATRRVLKLMFFLLLLHTIVALIANGSGPFAVIRTFLIDTFWIPEGWIGESLPLHREIVYSVLTKLWALPFWPILWSLCGLPMLGLMAAFAILSRIPGWIQSRTAGYGVQSPSYQNAQKGYLSCPSPGLRRRLIMGRRLSKLRKQNLPQAETLCQRTHQACLVQIFSYSGIANPFHLIQDLSAHPRWAIGKELASISPVFRDLVVTRDQKGQVGVFQRDRFLFPLTAEPLWLYEDANRQLTARSAPPDRFLGRCIQVHASRH